MEKISDVLANKIKNLFDNVNEHYDGLSWDGSNFFLSETRDQLYFGDDLVQKRIFVHGDILYLNCSEKINFNHPPGSKKKGKIEGSPSKFETLFSEVAEKSYEQFADILNQIGYPENITHVDNKNYLELGQIDKLNAVVNKIFNIAIIKTHYGGIIRKTVQSEAIAMPIDSRNKEPRQNDPELRRKIEVAAENKVIEYYESKGYKTNPVQTENKGWDFEFTKVVNENKITLYVEVKGRSSSDISAELTPNEYEQMNNNKRNYRICIVTEALKDNSRLFRFYWHEGAWKTNNGLELKISEKIGAVVSASLLKRNQ